MIYIISGLIIIFIIYLLIILFLKQSTTINDLKIRCDEATETIEILQEKQISAITKLSKPVQKQSDEKVLISLPKIKLRRTITLPTASASTRRSCVFVSALNRIFPDFLFCILFC